MFKLIYELLAGKNDDPVFANDVYPSVGLFTLLSAFILALIFYLALGRWKPIWDKLIHWVITLIFLVIIAIFFALTQSKGATGEDYNAFMYRFSMVNALVAFIYFIIFFFFI
ncbi:MAG: hypothetical protein WKG06_06315 [Segetibacter sp.]